MMSMASSSSGHLNGRPFVGGVGSVICGASRAQASLAKIMAVISTVPPPDITFLNSPKPDDGDSKAAASVVDLNLRLGLEMEEGEGEGEGHGGLATDPPLSPADDESISPAEEKSSEDECDLEEEEEEAINKEEKSEITNAERRGDESKGSSSSSEDGRNSEGLHLLIQVLGDELEPLPPPEPEEEEEEEEEEERVEDNKRWVRPSPKAKTKKRSRETTTATSTGSWLDSYEETAPLVRSKRGRNQALPSRYRDTLLEPWAKLPTVNRHGCRRQDH